MSGKRSGGQATDSEPPPPPNKRPRGSAGGASQHASGPTVVTPGSGGLRRATVLVDLTEINDRVQDSENEAGRLIDLAENMETKVMSMLREIQRLARALETLYVRLDLIRDVPPVATLPRRFCGASQHGGGAGGASQHAGGTLCKIGSSVLAHARSLSARGRRWSEFMKEWFNGQRQEVGQAQRS